MTKKGVHKKQVRKGFTPRKKTKQGKKHPYKKKKTSYRGGGGPVSGGGGR